MKELLSSTTIIPIGKKPWSLRSLSKMAAVSFAGVLAVSGLTVSDTASAQNVSTLVTGFGPLITGAALNVDENWLAAEEANKEFPLVELGAMDSTLGESKADFLLRVGSVLHSFTGRTGHEACSAIMESENIEPTSLPTYRVRLITNRSQVSCLRVMFDEKGFKYTGETIHSHPFSHSHSKDSYRNHDLRANRADQRLAGFSCGMRLTISDANFSPRDMENGGGYLVARGKLLYLDTPTEKVVEVGLINTTAPLPSLSVGGPNMINQHAQHAAQAVWTDRNSEVLPTTKCRVEVEGTTLRTKEVSFK